MSIEKKQLADVLERSQKPDNDKGNDSNSNGTTKIDYFKEYSRNLTQNRERYLQDIYIMARERGGADSEKYRQALFQELMENFIPIQSKIYASMEKDDVETIMQILATVNLSVMVDDLGERDDSLRPNPLFYSVELLDNAPTEESFLKRLRIFCLMLNHRSTILSPPSKRTDEFEKQLEMYKAYFAKQNQDEITGPENNFIKFIMGYNFKRKNLRKIILTEIAKGNRAQEFSKHLADDSPGNILTLALETGDVESVEFLVSKGVVFEINKPSLTKQFQYAPCIIFNSKFNKQISVGLARAIVPNIRRMSEGTRKLFCESLLAETPVARNPEFSSILIPAIKNGHFLALFILLDAFKLDETTFPFFKEKGIMALIGDSTATDEDISAFIDYIFAINSDPKEGWDDTVFNKNVQIRSEGAYYENNEYIEKSQEQSCLHNLAENSKLKTLERLLAMGANPNLMTKGDSLLHLAARKQNLDLIKLLLRFEADPSVLNSEGVTALDLAHHNSEIRAALLAKGATDFVRQAFDFPATPQETIENLRMENKLRAERAPQLGTSDRIRLVEDKFWFDDTMGQPNTNSYIWTEDSPVVMKEQPEEYYRFVENRVPHRMLQLIIIKKLDKLTREVAMKIRDAYIECYNRMMSEEFSLMQDFNIFTVHKTLIVPVSDIPALLKKYEGHVLLSMKWFSAYQEVYIYKVLTQKQKDKIDEINSFIRKNEAQLMAFWSGMLALIGNVKKEFHYFENEQAMNNYIRLMGYDSDPKIFLVSSPEHFVLGRQACCLEKLPEDVLEDWENNLRDVQHIIARNKLGWNLLHEQMKPNRLNSYLNSYPKIAIKIGTHTLEFSDLTQADDYRFLVNTIITKSDRLRELRNGDPAFFNNTPFISTCLIDSVTRPFKGGHQENPLGFPVHLALDIPFASAAKTKRELALKRGLAFSDPLNYVGPIDLGTPWGELGDPKTKIEFLRKSIRTRSITDIRQALYQQKLIQVAAETREALSQSKQPKEIICDPKQMSSPCPFMVQPSLEKDKMYRKPVPVGNMVNKDMGKLPLLTTDELLKSTCLDPTKPNSYSECIVLGNGFNEQKEKMEGRMLLVEKYFLDQFIEKGYAAVPAEDRKDVEESLSILSSIEKDTKGRLRLVLINTKMNGYKEKHTVLQQLEDLEAEKSRLKYRLEICDSREQRYRERGETQPKSLAEECAIAKAEMQALILRQKYLVELAKNPPLLTAMRRAKDKAQTQVNVEKQVDQVKASKSI